MREPHQIKNICIPKRLLQDLKNKANKANKLPKVWIEDLIIKELEK